MATVKDFSVEEKLTAVLSLQKIDSKIDDIRTLKGELPMGNQILVQLLFLPKRTLQFLKVLNLPQSHSFYFGTYLCPL